MVREGRLGVWACGRDPRRNETKTRRSKVKRISPPRSAGFGGKPLSFDSFVASLEVSSRPGTRRYRYLTSPPCPCRLQPSPPALAASSGRRWLSGAARRDAALASLTGTCGFVGTLTPSSLARASSDMCIRVALPAAGDRNVEARRASAGRSTGQAGLGAGVSSFSAVNRFGRTEICGDVLSTLIAGTCGFLDACSGIESCGGGCRPLTGTCGFVDACSGIESCGGGCRPFTGTCGFVDVAASSLTRASSDMESRAGAAMWFPPRDVYSLTRVNIPTWVAGEWTRGVT